MNSSDKFKLYFPTLLLIITGITLTAMFFVGDQSPALPVVGTSLIIVGTVMLMLIRSALNNND